MFTVNTKCNRLNFFYHSSVMVILPNCRLLSRLSINLGLLCSYYYFFFFYHNHDHHKNHDLLKTQRVNVKTAAKMVTLK